MGKQKKIVQEHQIERQAKRRSLRISRKKSPKSDSTLKISQKNIRRFALKSIMNKVSQKLRSETIGNIQKSKEITVVELLPKEKLEQFLSCSICLQRLTLPVDLQCGHTFCLKCIQQWQVTSRKSACPNCRNNATNDFLQINPAISRLIKVLINSYSTKQQKNMFFQDQGVIHAEFISLNRQLDHSKLAKDMPVEIKLSGQWKKGYIQQIEQTNSTKILKIRVGQNRRKGTIEVFTTADSYMLRHRIENNNKMVQRIPQRSVLVVDVSQESEVLQVLNPIQVNINSPLLILVDPIEQERQNNQQPSLNNENHQNDVEIIISQENVEPQQPSQQIIDNIIEVNISDAQESHQEQPPLIQINHSQESLRPQHLSNDSNRNSSFREDVQPNVQQNYYWPSITFFQIMPLFPPVYYYQ